MKQFLMRLIENEVHKDEERRMIKQVEKWELLGEIPSFFLEPSDTLPFPQRIIWRSCLLSKVASFIWEATWGKPQLWISSKG